MTATIDDFNLADDTLSGGVALGGLSVNVERVFEIVLPLGAEMPVLFDRQITKITIEFNVARVHDSAADAEVYTALHDATVPSSGTVTLTTTFGGVRTLTNAKLINDQMSQQIGKMTL